MKVPVPCGYWIDLGMYWWVLPNLQTRLRKSRHTDHRVAMRGGRWSGGVLPGSNPAGASIPHGNLARITA